MICLLLQDRTLYTSNLGDSRAILSTVSQVLPLSTDHKPSLPKEKARVINAGGRVE